MMIKSIEQRGKEEVRWNGKGGRKRGTRRKAVESMIIHGLTISENVMIKSEDSSAWICIQSEGARRARGPGKSAVSSRLSLKAQKIKTEMNYNGRGLGVFFTDHFSKLFTAPTAPFYFISALLICTPYGLLICIFRM